MPARNIPWRIPGLCGKYVSVGALTAGALLLAACATSDLRAIPTIFSSRISPVFAPVAVATTPASLKVMTLNMGHSRGAGFHQMFQRSSTAVNNLNAVLGVIGQQIPDIVALQEADGPSFWSGSFNHVEYLARHRSFARHVRGEHARGIKLSYGTALLSNLELWDPLAVTFDPNLSLTAKGFLVSALTWPAPPFAAVDVVSVHLDPFSRSARKQQAEELIATLQNRKRPVIVMGDFNTDWRRTDSTLKLIARELGLKAYQPQNGSLHTFPKSKKRLDWILISPEFEFLSYRVLADRVSDHLGIVAELGLVTDQQRDALPRMASQDPQPRYISTP